MIDGATWIGFEGRRGNIDEIGRIGDEPSDNEVFTCGDDGGGRGGRLCIVEWRREDGNRGNWCCMFCFKNGVRWIFRVKALV